LNPVENISGIITSFKKDDNSTFIEEGQFVDDNLYETFGRRLCMNGTVRMGWFKEDGSTLLGYGRK
jgi:hypothetical protein